MKAQPCARWHWGTVSSQGRAPHLVLMGGAPYPVFTGQSTPSHPHGWSTPPRPVLTGQSTPSRPHGEEYLVPSSQGGAPCPILTGKSTPSRPHGRNPIPSSWVEHSILFSWERAPHPVLTGGAPHLSRKNGRCTGTKSHIRDSISSQGSTHGLVTLVSSASHFFHCL